ncbi:nicotianamine synthase family protein [Pseudonocardia nantongensis]|uniref:nicotianamine synthase family protein n=1 Tax=Pseudonocardia nantongensis TaxID=1181885 RepID=UPI00397C2977
MRRVLALRGRLEATDLRPGPAVDAAFGELVGLCCHPPDVCTGTVLDRLAPHLDTLRALSAIGEGRMEEHWADRIATAADPRAELERFPYLGNYHDLVRMELAALAAVGVPAPRHVVVLGSGPLPLTGLVLAQRHGASVVHVDRDPGAVRAGSAVAAATGPGVPVRSLLADLEAPRLRPELAAELGRADLVLVGALVGADPDTKSAISARLAEAVRPAARLLVRSAAGLRTVLYPPVGTEDLPGLEVLLEVHPRTDVVNSVLVARARE